MTRTSPQIPTKNEKMIMDELRQAGVPILATHLNQRTAFQSHLHLQTRPRRARPRPGQRPRGRDRQRRAARRRGGRGHPIPQRKGMQHERGRETILRLRRHQARGAGSTRRRSRVDAVGERLGFASREATVRRRRRPPIEEPTDQINVRAGDRGHQHASSSGASASATPTAKASGCSSRRSRIETPPQVVRVSGRAAVRPGVRQPAPKRLRLSRAPRRADQAAGVEAARGRKPTT